MPAHEKIRWAPRLSQAKLWRLYQSDAHGLLDEELLAEIINVIWKRREDRYDN